MQKFFVLKEHVKKSILLDKKKEEKKKKKQPSIKIQFTKFEKYAEIWEKNCDEFHAALDFITQIPRKFFH